MTSQYPGRDGDEPARGFTRGGFAPIPHRHHDLPPLRPEADSMDRRAPPPPMDAPRPDARAADPYRRDDYPPERDMRSDRNDWDQRGPRRGGPGPAWEEDYDRPKRRRSPSPQAGNYRPRLYSPSPPPGSRSSLHGPGPEMRYNQPTNLPDPATLDYQLNFRQFVDWFRVSHPQTAKADEDELRRYKASLEEGTADPSISKEKVGIGKRYERYRKEYTSRQLFSLFLSHKPSPWFQERYSADPQFVALRKRVNRQGRVPTVEKYIDALRQGHYDTVTFEQSEDKSRRGGGARRASELEEPEGLDRALGEAIATGDDHGRVDIPPNTSQVFVKTVPPTIGRKELEALFSPIDGFQFLALSEPSAKKGFHRVAWAQFADGIDTEEVVKKLDGSRIDNFTLHMGVNATATNGRLRVTHPQANELHQLEADGKRARDLAIKLEDELLADESEEAGTEPPAQGSESAPTEGAAGIFVKGPILRERGSDLVGDYVSRLLESQGLLGDDLNRDLRLRKARLVTDHWISYLRNGLSTCYYCVAPNSFPEELQRKCVAHVRPPMRPASLAEATQQPDEANAEEGDQSTGRSGMDTDAAAPRKEASEGDEAGAADREDRDDEDQREIGGESRDGTNAADDAKARAADGKRDRPATRFHEERWAETLEHKIRPLLEQVDVTEYGGRDPDAEAKRLTAPSIKQEEPSRYRCKECSKLFKAPEFIIKHVTLKHGEMIKPKLDDVAMLNNFVLDPQHLPVTAQTPPSINDQLPLPPQALANPAAIFNPAFLGAGNPNGANGGGPAGGPANMMQQQMMMMMQMQQAMMMQMAGGGGGGGGPGGQNGAGGGPGAGPQGPGRGLQERMGGYADLPKSNQPLPAPPPGGEDPRARRGRVSYQDLDAVGGGGDGGLPY